MEKVKEPMNEQENKLTDEFFKLDIGAKRRYWFADCGKFHESIAWFMDKYGGYINGFMVEKTDDDYNELRLLPSASLRLTEDKENKRPMKKPYYDKK